MWDIETGYGKSLVLTNPPRWKRKVDMTPRKATVAHQHTCPLCQKNFVCERGFPCVRKPIRVCDSCGTRRKLRKKIMQEQLRLFENP